MHTQVIAGSASVPRMVDKALRRVDAALTVAHRMRAEGNAARARKMARVAELYERESRWWGVLDRWTWLDSDVPGVLGRATIAAKADALSQAERYRELERKYWQLALAVASDSGVAA